MNAVEHKGLSVWVISRAAGDRSRNKQWEGMIYVVRLRHGVRCAVEEKVRARLQAKDEGVAPERCVTSWDCLLHRPAPAPPARPSLLIAAWSYAWTSKRSNLLFGPSSNAQGYCFHCLEIPWSNSFPNCL